MYILQRIISIKILPSSFNNYTISIFIRLAACGLLNNENLSTNLEYLVDEGKLVEFMIQPDWVSL